MLILYYCLMPPLTLDRFLVFYLNLKYLVLCSSGNILKCIYAIVMLSLLLSLMLVIPIKLKEKKNEDITAVLPYTCIF